MTSVSGRPFELTQSMLADDSYTGGANIYSAGLEGETGGFGDPDMLSRITPAVGKLGFTAVLPAAKEMPASEPCIPVDFKDYWHLQEGPKSAMVNPATASRRDSSLDA